MGRSLLWLLTVGFLNMGLASCSLTRPLQVNLTLRLSHKDAISIDEFINEVAHRLSMKVSATDSNIPNADPSRQFELYSDIASVFVIPTPDNKCVPKGNAHMTYKEKLYRLDVLPKSGDLSKTANRIEAAFKAVGSMHGASITTTPDRC